MHFTTSEVDVYYGGRIIKTYVVANSTTKQIDPESSAFLFHLARMGKRPNTLKSYASSISVLLTYIKSDPDIQTWSAMTDRFMRAYLGVVLPEHRGNTAETINRHISRLKGFYEYMYENGWLSTPLGITWKIDSTREAELMLREAEASKLDPYQLGIQYTPKAEFNRLLSYLKTKDSFKHTRNEIILKMGFYSGLRANEVVNPQNLRISRIKECFDKKEENGGLYLLKIIGKGNKVRTIEIEVNVMDQIQRFITQLKRSNNGDLLICHEDGKPLSEGYASSIYSQTKKSLIADNDAFATQFSSSKRSFHSLRHSYATNLAEKCRQNGWSIQLLKDRMGHEDEATTAIYVHFNAKLHGDQKLADAAASKINSSSARYEIEND